MPEYGLEVKTGQEPFPTHSFQDGTHFAREEFICADTCHASSTGGIRGRFLACLFVPGSSLLHFLKMDVTFSFLWSAEIFPDCHDFLKTTEKGLSMKLAISFCITAFIPSQRAEFAEEFLNCVCLCSD